MTNNSELDKVKAKIRALSEKTASNGCTEAEANSAFKKIGELLETFNLEMSEVDLNEETCVQDTVETNSKKVTPVAGALVAISRFCGVKVWQSRGYNSISYKFFGLESDVQMAVYLTDMIEKAIKTESDAFKKTEDYKMAHNKRGATYSFYHGMANRISQRLNNMRREMEEEMARKAEERGTMLGSDVQALVVVKNAKVEEEFKNLGMKLRSNYTTRRVTSANGYTHGSEAGNKVNLNRPVGSKSGPALLT